MKFNKLFTLLAVLALLQGCAAMVIAGATTGAVGAANDRRSLGTQIDDSTIESRVATALDLDETIDDKARIIVKSVNGNLLVVGQAPSDQLRQLVITTVNSVKGIKQVHDQIRIGNVTTMSTQTIDTWITTKVKLKLLTEEAVNSHNIKVLTENAEVYLMGLVTADEANKAVEIARNISGVAKVIKVFEVM
jgi:osmotically-inducible protein OsmY